MPRPAGTPAGAPAGETFDGPGTSLVATYLPSMGAEPLYAALEAEPYANLLVANPARGPGRVRRRHDRGPFRASDQGHGHRRGDGLGAAVDPATIRAVRARGQQAGTAGAAGRQSRGPQEGVLGRPR